MSSNVAFVTLSPSAWGDLSALADFNIDDLTLNYGSPAIGVGTSSSSTTLPAATTGVGVGTSSARPATTSAGKRPRTTASLSVTAARRRRHAGAAAALRRSGGGRDSDDSSDGSNGDMHGNLDRLLRQLRRRAGGRHIAGITHTDTITTTYKDRQPPTVRRSSTRSSGTSS